VNLILLETLGYYCAAFRGLAIYVEKAVRSRGTPNNANEWTSDTELETFDLICSVPKAIAKDLHPSHRVMIISTSASEWSMVQQHTPSMVQGTGEQGQSTIGRSAARRLLYITRPDAGHGFPGVLRQCHLRAGLVVNHALCTSCMRRCWARPSWCASHLA
jgi:hypothetical protein